MTKNPPKKKKTTRATGATGSGVRTVDGTRTVTLAEFDRMAEEGSDELDDFGDLSKAIRASEAEAQRVNVDFPKPTVAALDAEASRLGIARQSLIKMWIGERLDEVNRADTWRNLPPNTPELLHELLAQLEKAPAKKRGGK